MHKERKPLIAGNWKMHHGGSQGVALAQQVAALKKEVPNVDLMIAPPYTALAAVAHEIEHSGVHLAAQNMHGKPHGAFTGEISADMLNESGARWVLIGHSERRHIFGEKDAEIAVKVGHALNSSLCVVLCVGETLEERQAGRTLEVVKRQIDAVLEPLATDPHEEAIAYEPVWAIGTGKTATPRDAAGMHRRLRAWLEQHFGPVGADRSILYGGSVKPNNAAALMAAGDVDGFLVGGASLEAEAFLQIVRLVVSAA